MKKTVTTICLALIGYASCIGATIDKEATSDNSATPLADYVRSFMCHPEWRAGPSVEGIRKIVKDNEISKEAYIVTLEEIANEILADTVVRTNKTLNLVATVPRYGWIVQAIVGNMGSLGDSEFLPWLEKQANESQWAGVRQNAAVSYVKIAGLDATPFVQKILSGSEEKYDFNCKYLVTKEFFEQIAKAESEKTPQKKIDAAYIMLIELAQSVAYEGHADRIDRFLCEHLEEYRISVQREKAVTRFIASANEIAKADFIKKSSEVLKTPKAERTDLSKRFSGLVEVKLEDEQQTEATKPEEDK